jgi:hypothetical protein
VIKPRPAAFAFERRNSSVDGSKIRVLHDRRVTELARASKMLEQIAKAMARSSSGSR